LKYLGHQNITFQDIAGKGTKQISFNQIDIETAGKYAAEDADITLKLHQHREIFVYLHQKETVRVLCTP